MSVSGIAEISRPSGEAKICHARPSTALTIDSSGHPGAGQPSVIPLENGIQVNGMGMDPGFHRGDDKAWIPAFAGKTERAVDFQSTLSKTLGFELRVL
jgi:hypothetical protein